MSSLAFVLGIAREIGVGVFIKRLARSMGVQGSSALLFHVTYVRDEKSGKSSDRTIFSLQKNRVTISSNR